MRTSDNSKAKHFSTKEQAQSYIDNELSNNGEIVNPNFHYTVTYISHAYAPMLKVKKGGWYIMRKTGNTLV